jgi:hypothetical protein
MQLIDLLNQLDKAGTLAQLYQAGVVNLKAYSHREILLHYRALLASPTYADQPSQAARATATGLGCGLRTVHRAIREMQQAV